MILARLHYGDEDRGFFKLCVRYVGKAGEVIYLIWFNVKEFHWPIADCFAVDITNRQLAIGNHKCGTVAER